MSQKILVADRTDGVVAITYIMIGVAGFLCNLATLMMIVSYRVYRLSAYTIMANLALADAIMLIIAGIICGLEILTNPTSIQSATAATSVALLYNGTEKGISNDHNHQIHPDVIGQPKIAIFDEFLFNERKSQLSIADWSSNQKSGCGSCQKSIYSIFLLSFFEISAWTAGMISYALLGINRCVAICFYKTRARAINRLSFALAASVITWILSIFIAFLGTVPEPLMGMRNDMWTVSFLSTDGQRPTAFIALESLFNLASLLAQWSCSVMVLIKIRKARLTFQFFYPSLICTISSIIFFAKPFMASLLTRWQFIFLHLIWLCNHMCNPFIYAYFNERMRASYKQWLTCVLMRQYLQKWKKKYLLQHGTRLQISRNSKTSPNVSLRARNSCSENFVRSSLQIQSRNFEQLCEFMMRVSTENLSSEGWNEESSCGCDELKEFDNTFLFRPASHSSGLLECDSPPNDLTPEA